MAAGYAHIFTVGTTVDSAGIRVPQYQFTFYDGTSSYARVFDESRLIEFLIDELGLDPSLLDRVLDELRTKGNTTIYDLEVSEHDTAALGLEQVPSDT
jgi:hypothetical protein